MPNDTEWQWQHRGSCGSGKDFAITCMSHPLPRPPCPACSLVVLSQLFHVMSPLFRGFLAALAFHFDSLASAKKRHSIIVASSPPSLSASLSLSPFLAMSLSCCCCCLAWLVAFALSADSHKFCFAFHFYFIYKSPPSATHTHTDRHMLALSLRPRCLPLAISVSRFLACCPPPARNSSTRICSLVVPWLCACLCVCVRAKFIFICHILLRFLLPFFSPFSPFSLLLLSCCCFRLL